MATRRRPQPRTRTEVRRPDRLVLDHHETLEHTEIRAHGLLVKWTVTSSGVHPEGLEGHRGGDTAGQGRDQSTQSDWISFDAVDTTRVDTTDIVQVVPKNHSCV